MRKKGVIHFVLAVSFAYAGVARANDLVVGDGQIYEHQGSAECQNYEKFILGADSTLVIGDKSICIIAKIMEVGARVSIVAFAGTPEYRAPQGAHGTSPGSGGSSGTSGLHAGDVTLRIGELRLSDQNSPLLVDLTGQYGGYGGNGAQGAPGAPGAEGGAGEWRCRGVKTPEGPDILCSCVRAAGSGQQGGAGGSGGDGGPGGSGGDGGDFTLKLGKGDPVTSMKVIVSGGLGETGGKAGAGGPGGQGGAGGASVGECASGAQGPTGPDGAAGRDRVGERASAGEKGGIHF